MSLSFALAALLATAPADAGSVYVNGVRADGLEGQRFEDVDVHIDPKGNIWIDAPRYTVEVADGSPSPTPAAVPAGRYWLVSEEGGSRGHTVDVVINGELVRKVRSGDKQVILDLREWLRPGANTVVFTAPGAADASGGALQLHVGTGSTSSGTLILDDPEITFVRRSDGARRPASRTFSLTVR